jgi:hypothetical protein
MVLIGENQSTQQKPSPSYAFSTKYPNGQRVGLKTGIRDYRPATYSTNHGTSFNLPYEQLPETVNFGFPLSASFNVRYIGLNKHTYTGPLYLKKHI